MPSNKTVYIITGPTASGKSGIAMELAKRIPAEIISADSMQVYRSLDIATAKPSPADRISVPHHLIDIRNPEDRYTVAEWLDDCRAAIDAIQARGNTAIICGGTSLYIKALVEGLDFAPNEDGNRIRAELEARLEREGAQAMHQELERLDPAAAATIHPNNVRRVIRALEIIEETGQAVADYHQETVRLEAAHDFRVYLPSHPRQRLYERVNQRVDQMMEVGLLDEVRRVLELDLPPDATCMQAIGYKEFIPYINGSETLESCVDHLKMSTRRYAKRQLTFFRPIDWVRYLEVGENDSAEDLVDRIIHEQETE